MCKQLQDKDYLYSSPLATLSFIFARLRNQSFEEVIALCERQRNPSAIHCQVQEEKPVGNIGLHLCTAQSTAGLDTDKGMCCNPKGPCTVGWE